MINTSILEEVADTREEGSLSVLSINRGDLKFNFNKDSAEDTQKARKTIKDMLSRGYLIFVVVDGKEVKIKDFDPTTDEYIIKIDKRSKLWKDSDKPKGKKVAEKRIKATKTKATAIAPTGGG